MTSSDRDENWKLDSKLTFSGALELPTASTWLPSWSGIVDFGFLSSLGRLNSRLAVQQHTKAANPSKRSATAESIS